MKLKRIIAWMVVGLGLLTIGCSNEFVEPTLGEGYGYVQFKLYKAASYQPAAQAKTRAAEIVDQLDLLSQAHKVQVTLLFEGTTITQTLPINQPEGDAAEYGLRSDKLQLMSGKYELVTIQLYNAQDELIYVNAPSTESTFVVTDNGLTMHDITINVAPRGKVKFTFGKAGAFLDKRAVSRVYTFDEVKKVDLTIEHTITGEQTNINGLKCKFDIHFDESDDLADGYETSSLLCDSLVWVAAGSYKVAAYSTYDEGGALLENNRRPAESTFSVKDNETTKANVGLSLYESDPYIQDYYALKAIWEALDGKNWYYVGENFNKGANWNFNRDVDLWGDQPGVELHSNGRVARIDISEFAFRGHMPAALGQLTELVELYLGTHNDTNNSTYDPTLDPNKSLSERSRNRMELHGEWLRKIHVPTQMSEPCARALAEHGIEIEATRLYKEMNESQIFDTKGHQRTIRKMDTSHGRLNNGLLSLPAEIKNLKKLEYLYIANSEIAELPAEVAELSACTDIEIYNCPKMVKFPMAITQMPELISLNISNNAQWSAEEVYKGMNGLATGPSREKIQILYARQNKLKEIPESFKNMKKIGLLDLAYNQIEKLPALGKEIAPVQLYLDNNNISELPRDAEGYFCGYDDAETLSFRFNKLTKVPNIFSATSLYTIASVDFSGNQITGFEGEEDGTYKGIKVNTFTLSQNPIEKYPTCLAESGSIVSYIILRACKLNEIPKGSFEGDKMIDLMSLDLSYNYLTDLPREMHAGNMPYLYGIDLSFNSFSHFPYEPLDSSGLTVFALRSQRDEKGNRTLKEWPTGIFQHSGLRGLYLGSNDLRKVDDTISTLIYYLDISDNPNIIFDAADICYAWMNGAYILIYDKTQNILNCSYMLE
ncbi:MAG: DUF4458 domain-containing protein [Tidjanibacter sp.]|nr:DUF4458 domain-containing protein [Tidjanibacter sp.]